MNWTDVQIEPPACLSYAVAGGSPMQVVNACGDSPPGNRLVRDYAPMEPLLRLEQSPLALLMATSMSGIDLRELGAEQEYLR